MPRVYMPRVTPANSNHAIPMRVCNHCNRCFRTDCVGHLSLSHRAWYCNDTCYQMKRVLFGEPMSRDQLRLLAAMREKYFPHEKLNDKAEHTTYLIKTRQIKVIIDNDIRDQVGDETE